MRLTYKDKYGQWCSDGSKASLQLGNPSENHPSILWGDAVNKLAAYEDAEEQGRLVILPKTLYEADDTPLITGVTEWEVTGVRFYDGIVQAYTVKTKNVQTIIYGSEIGKTVFLTREDAEAALNGGKDDANN